MACFLTIYFGLNLLTEINLVPCLFSLAWEIECVVIYLSSTWCILSRQLVLLFFNPANYCLFIPLASFKSATLRRIFAHGFTIVLLPPLKLGIPSWCNWPWKGMAHLNNYLRCWASSTSFYYGIMNIIIHNITIDKVFYTLLSIYVLHL